MQFPHNLYSIKSYFSTSRQARALLFNLRTIFASGLRFYSRSIAPGGPEPVQQVPSRPGGERPRSQPQESSDQHPAQTRSAASPAPAAQSARPHDWRPLIGSIANQILNSGLGVRHLLVGGKPLLMAGTRIQVNDGSCPEKHITSTWQAKARTDKRTFILLNYR